jgi:hypothetical protein
MRTVQKLAHCNKSQLVEMLLFLDNINPDSGQTSLCSRSLMLCREATNTSFIVFGLTCHGLEPTNQTFEASMFTIAPSMQF